ncbi:hypothetical protein [Xanthomonas theicola]|uniref:hypothetical protein n=1 Tax=Xanthomonas theicola TaxID=56464 RepID=UPI000FF8B51C|nr:hypothetical protein [Xanthomonas theicola]QNH24196.1 hypothetical protein G4Q83_04710 [Xanthomonas theicola]
MSSTLNNTDAEVMLPWGVHHGPAIACGLFTACWQQVFDHLPRRPVRRQFAQCTTLIFVACLDLLVFHGAQVRHNFNQKLALMGRSLFFPRSTLASGHPQIKIWSGKRVMH